MNKPVLTIAIPTFNRNEQVKKQFLSVKRQLTDEVRVIIIDNHSNNPIIDLIDTEKDCRVNIIRNEFNIGADGNIAKCFDTCHTDWLWTLSDDDIITEDAVQIILKHIKMYDDTLFFNFNKKHTELIKGIDSFVNCAKRYYAGLFWRRICV